MKSNVRIIIVFLIMGILVVGYYFWLSNRDLNSNSEKSNPQNKEVNEIIAKKIDDNYPGTPIEVLNLYLRITKAYYKTELTNEQIEGLGGQALKLFDPELSIANPKETFIENLKKDIKRYNDLGRYISDYAIEKNSEVDYKALDGKYYAIIDAMLYVREGSNFKTVYTEYTLRKDEKGNWKILFWTNKAELKDGSK